MNGASQDMEIRLRDDGLAIRTDRDGYWFGNEVLELVAAMGHRTWNRAVDLGCGDGVIALLLARRGLAREIWAVDIDDDHCRRAAVNIDTHGLTGMIRVFRRDIRQLRGMLQKSSVDLITANPPFFPLDRDFLPVSESETHARQEVNGNLRIFLHAADYLASRRADLFMIYHPGRLDVLFYELQLTRFRCKSLRILHHRDGRALFVICHAANHGKPGMQIEPPITMADSIKTSMKESHHGD
ncbi:methyltransferase [bacterium]|nr:methyltransferase [candidate division CSSED10-310 bacterium]